MTNKQKENIRIAEENMKDLSDVPENLFRINYLQPIGFGEITEMENSTSPEEAFFEFTEKDFKVIACSDVRRLARLIWGHRRIALNDKFEKEAKND